MTSTTTDQMNLTINVTQATKEWIADQSERFDTPRDLVVERLVEEAVRMRRFPRIGFREEGPRRRACVRGTRLDVWFVIDTLRETSREHVVSLLEENRRSSHDLDAAISYYEAYADEIDPFIEEYRQLPEYWQAKYPKLNVEVIDK
ncbi:MAG: hypothetical protein WEC79_00010 [Thermomicrobiales bacterium]